MITALAGFIAGCLVVYLTRVRPLVRERDAIQARHVAATPRDAHGRFVSVRKPDAGPCGWTDR